MADAARPDWTATLDELESSLRGWLDALDQYESRHAQLLSEGDHHRTPRLTLVRAEPEDDGWGERIASANRQVNEIERVLGEHQSAWGRWREAFTAWQASLQQWPGDTSTSG